MTFDFNGQYTSSPNCVILTDSYFNVVKLNPIAHTYFEPYIQIDTKFNIVDNFKFNIVNQGLDFLKTELMNNIKWNGIVSFCYDKINTHYYSAIIHSVKYKNVTNFVIQVEHIKNNIKEEAESNLLFKNHFSHILNASGEGYVLMNKDYIIESINKRARDLTKITHGQMMQAGHSMFEYLPKEAHQYCIDISEKVFNGEKIKILSEYPGIKGEKTYLNTEYIPAYDNEKQVSGIIVHVVDISEQHYGKIKLEESAFQMQSILSSTSEGLAMISLDYKVIQFNDKMAYFVNRVFKLKKKGKIGSNFFDYILPERVEHIKKVFAKIIEGEKVELQQKINSHWLLASYTPIFDKDHKVNAICISIRDITEIINKQIVIEQREILYNTTLNNIAEVVILLDEKFRVQHFNKAADDLFQRLNYFPIDQIAFSLTKLGFKTVNKRDDYLLNQNNWRSINDQKRDVLISFTQNKIKKTFLTNFSVVIDYNDSKKQTKQFVIPMRDISRVDKMSEKINQLSLIAKNISNGVIITDKDGYIQWVNNAFTQITEYEFNEVIGRRAASFLEGPETDLVAAKLIQDKVRTKMPFTCEILNYKKNGEKVWIELSVQPILDIKGNLFQVYCLQTDITQRKLLEKQLEDERKENQHNITRAVYKAYEEERSFLSKELHDSVNQKITASLFNLKRVTKLKDPDPELLNSSINLLQESMKEIRNLSRKLIATELLNIGFEEAINQIVFTTTESVKNLKCIITISDKCELGLSNDLKVNIFRIVQEQMQNIIKHSKASLVTICASFNENNQFELITADNGKGFNSKKQRSGVGLINILNRVESFNGKCNITTSAKQGCKYQITIPLTNP